MLKTIIKKEIQNNVYSFRFLVTFVLLLAVVAFTIFVLTNDYVKKVDEYSQRQAEIENYLKNYAHYNRVGSIISPSQPPVPFFMLIRGLSSDVNIGHFDNDPLPVMFPLLDLTFIVAILLSLVALLFSYDAVCGEKEDGTLKLMLSNSISRSTIVLGKIAGGTLTLLLPFLTSLLIGLLIILFNPRVSWKSADWGALGLIFLGSLLYFAFFYGLGIFISSRHQSGSASIMTSLFVWVLLVLVIPNLSPFAASFLSPSPSRIKIGREVSRLTDVERDQLGRKLMAERLQALTKKYPVLAENIPEAEAKERMAKDPAIREAYDARVREVQAAWDEANRIQNEKAGSLWGELDRKEAAQTRLAAVISMISPLSDFTYLATDLSSTGLQNERYFHQIAEDWARRFDEYGRIKISLLQKQDPTKDWWNTPVDMSDRPKFTYQEAPLGLRFKQTFADFVVLLVFNVLFFGAGYVSFIKYDVR
jgi:ABC-type transport system involved in multi-copper enzyme maturation permease subunit